VVFDEAAFDADMRRLNDSAVETARLARRHYEAKGVATARLRRCAEQGEDGTALPNCLKVYLPEPAGRFGMVFQLEIDPDGLRLYYLAFGVRHHPPGSHALTLYELAHQRLHG
jgi:hypothetical protein